jgi:hypothetical protein
MRSVTCKVKQLLINQICTYTALPRHLRLVSYYPIFSGIQPPAGPCLDRTILSLMNLYFTTMVLHAKPYTVRPLSLLSTKEAFNSRVNTMDKRAKFQVRVIYKKS